MATSKCPKISTSLDSEASIDRISALPDSLISHILSFLPTKHAVGTSILSNRWKLLWTSIANLDFDYELFFSPPNLDQTDKENTNFIHFVNRVLVLLNQPYIHKFRLRCDEWCDDHYVNLWITAALSRGTEELDFYLDDDGYQKHPLPRTLFTSITLVVLKLEGALSVEILTTSVTFPSLKILHLCSVYYEDDECVRKLFANCSVLEELVVKRFEMDGAHSFSICAPVLKKLVFEFDEIGCGHNDYKLEINAPTLEYLYIADACSGDFAFENLSSLVEATVDINLCGRRNIGNDDDYNCAVYRTLDGISNVKVLMLSSCTMESLTSGSHFSAPKFCNLKRLKVSFHNRSHDWRVIPEIIKYSDKLEELICSY